SGSAAFIPEFPMTPPEVETLPDASVAPPPVVISGPRPLSQLRGMSVAYYHVGVQAEAEGDSETPIEACRECLQIDPVYRDAHDSLGRLALKAPVQPFLEDAAKSFPEKLYEIIIEVRNPCNYRCFYCVGAGRNNEPVKEFDLAKIADI